MVTDGTARALRIAALLAALFGVAWDAAAAWWLAFPGPSGEWAQLAVPAAWTVGVPGGAIALLLLRAAGRSPSRLRLAVQLAAGVSIAIPVLMSLLAGRR